MLLDGYWKKELQGLSKSLVFWSKNRHSAIRDYVEHKINRGLLYSAVIIRKIIEDEKAAKKSIAECGLMMPALPIMKATVPVRRYEHTSKDKFILNSKVILQDYDIKKGVEEEMKLEYLCNQIIHSVPWGIVMGSEKTVQGVLLASDRYKDDEIYYLALSEWLKTIAFVVKNAAV